MNKIFIDCGAYRGGLLRTFQLGRPGFKIYAFECNPLLKDINYGPDVTRINKAVWTKDEQIEFFLSKTNPEKVQGSTIYRDKITGNIDKDCPVKAEAIDFSKWLDNTVHPDDYVVVKMNIEGAEYDVIPKMIKDLTINLIDELYIRWHWNKINFPPASHREIEGALKASGVTYFNDYKYLLTGVPQ
jgi:FkbM family methyltransferase